MSSRVPALWLFAGSLMLAMAAGAVAQTPAPMPPPIAAPQDRPYPGVIRLAVDASDVTRHIFRVRETIPVESGALTLLYPKWGPGTHAPVGRIDNLAGLIIRADGQRLEWTRDTVDVYAFHLTVPAGAHSLDVEFQFLSATDENQGYISVSPAVLELQWLSVVLYPAGYFVRQVPVEASVRLPDGWQFAIALDIASAAPSTWSGAIPLPAARIFSPSLISSGSVTTSAVTSSGGVESGAWSST